MAAVTICLDFLFIDIPGLVDISIAVLSGNPVHNFLRIAVQFGLSRQMHRHHNVIGVTHDYFVT